MPQILTRTLAICTLFASMPAVTVKAAETPEAEAEKPRPPSDQPYESAAFDPLRVNEIEAMALEAEERAALAGEAAKDHSVILRLGSEDPGLRRDDG